MKTGPHTYINHFFFFATTTARMLLRLSDRDLGALHAWAITLKVCSVLSFQRATWGTTSCDDFTLMHHSYSLRVAEEKHYILYEQDYFILSSSQSLADGVEDGFHQFIIIVACHPRDYTLTIAASLLKDIYLMEKHTNLHKKSTYVVNLVCSLSSQVEAR